ncbi:hypothetical protein BV898_11728 [Hypsibius exemplaris]|uniref:Prominin-1-A n=1 Tax=Hypsibius exemplaris TaxID=2072580 RepID=A0A1W0WG14_HYPEX|nr:hypothetical protein BV898_11728 [Hypsibius exemplaris]
MMFISSGELVTSLKASDKIVDTSIMDLEKLFNDIKKQLDHVVMDCYVTLQTRVKKELTNIGPFLADMIMSNLNNDKNLNLGSVTTLKRNVVDLRAQLARVSAKTAALQSAITALNTKMAGLQQKQKDLLNADSCKNTPLGACQQVLAMLETVFPVPSIDLTSQMASMDQLVILVTGIDPQATIGAATNSGPIIKVADDADTTFSDLQGKISSYMTTMRTMLDNIIGQLEDARSTAHSFTRYPKDYGPKMSYVAIGKACFFGLIVGLTIFGVVIGYSKFDKRILPTHRIGNVLWGWRLLMISVYLIFILAWFWMLLVVILMVIASQLDEALCPILMGESNNFTLMRDTISLVNQLVTPVNVHLNDKSTLDVSGVVSMCMANVPLYTAFSMSSIFNISGIQQQLTDVNLISKMADLDINFQAIHILPAGTEARINTAVLASAFDFGSTITALNVFAGPTQGFAAFAQLDRNAAATMASPGSQSMNDVAASWNGVDKTDMPALLALRDGVVSSIKTLDTQLKNLSQSTAAALATAKNAQLFFQSPAGAGSNSDASTLVKKAATQYSSRIVNYAQQYVKFVKNSVLHDIGTCRPAYDSYHAISSLLCIGIIQPINGLWFSIGLILILFIPMIFLNTYLGRYYSRARVLDLKGLEAEIMAADPIVGGATNAEYSPEPITPSMGLVTKVRRSFSRNNNKTIPLPSGRSGRSSNMDGPVTPRAGLVDRIRRSISMSPSPRSGRRDPSGTNLSMAV